MERALALGQVTSARDEDLSPVRTIPTASSGRVDRLDVLEPDVVLGE